MIIFSITITYLKKAFVSIIIFSSTLAFSQNFQKIQISKKILIKTFKSTIDQKKRNRITINSNPWSSETEKYFKSDTVKFKNLSTHSENYCNIINWTFYRKNKFIRSFGEYCDEPASVKVTTENDYFNFKLTEKNQSLFFDLYSKEKLIEKFEILSLEKYQSLSYKNETQYILTLKRIR